MLFLHFYKCCFRSLGRHLFFSWDLHAEHVLAGDGLGIAPWSVAQLLLEIFQLIAAIVRIMWYLYDEWHVHALVLLTMDLRDMANQSCCDMHTDFLHMPQLFLSEKQNNYSSVFLWGLPQNRATPSHHPYVRLGCSMIFHCSSSSDHGGIPWYPHIIFAWLQDAMVHMTADGPVEAWHG